jgi:putative Mg2+ transporter-C (MgtC) family protein
MQFKKGVAPSEEKLRASALSQGYEIASGSISINFKDGMPEWKFVAIALGKGKGAPMTDMAQALTDHEGVENFFLSPARN